MLLELTNPQPLNFSSARAGVVAAPNITVDEVSRKLGPIMANLPTDPAALFPDADLLGIVPLRKIIAAGTAAAPTITWSRDDASDCDSQLGAGAGRPLFAPAVQADTGGHLRGETHR